MFVVLPSIRPSNFAIVIERDVVLLSWKKRPTTIGNLEKKPIACVERELSASKRLSFYHQSGLDTLVSLSDVLWCYFGIAIERYRTRIGFYPILKKMQMGEKCGVARSWNNGGAPGIAENDHLAQMVKLSAVVSR